ncbi:MAG: hypothetical protein ABJL99_17445 [Aliishimia sp.]
MTKLSTQSNTQYSLQTALDKLFERGAFAEPSRDWHAAPAESHIVFSSVREPKASSGTAPA